MPYRFSISVFTDGACDNTGRGTVGRSMGMGIVVQEGTSYKILEACYGDEGTSNIAEWLAMFRGLTVTLDLVRREYRDPGLVIVILTDSMLVIRQMKREWIVSDPILAHYFRGCCKLEAQLEDMGHKITFSWVPREENELADMLSKVGRRDNKKERPSRRMFGCIENVQEELERIYYETHPRARQRNA